MTRYGSMSLFQALEAEVIATLADNVSLFH
jgi:hypothetical protein